MPRGDPGAPGAPSAPSAPGRYKNALGLGIHCPKHSSFSFFHGPFSILHLRLQASPSNLAAMPCVLEVDGQSQKPQLAGE